MKHLTQTELKAMLRYDPNSGNFVRIAVPQRKQGGRSDKIGQIAGWKDKRGRVYISVEGNEWAAHRLAFLYMTGMWPSGIVDHRDCNHNYKNYCIGRFNSEEEAHAAYCARAKELFGEFARAA